MAEQLTAQQRAQLFAMSTRQNFQMLAKQTATVTPNTLQFTLPKARLLGGLYMSVEIVLPKSETLAGDTEVAKIIRRISLDLNNGFAPFVLSGRQCQMYNHVDIHAEYLKAWQVREISESIYELNFFLPCTTNPRDPIGLILLQNDQTNVTLTIDLANASEIGLASDVSKVDIKVMTETFSIPANANAYPDLSVLKLVNGRTDSLPTAGQQIIKMTTGTIYRKIIFRIFDEDGHPMTSDDITSPIELVFNQADINYSVDPHMLQMVNAKQLGSEPEEGLYMFDFSSGGGLVNLGGTRDFIDSANLTEFWIRFTTQKKGKVEIVTETLARLS